MRSTNLRIIALWSHPYRVEPGGGLGFESEGRNPPRKNPPLRTRQGATESGWTNRISISTTLINLLAECVYHWCVHGICRQICRACLAAADALSNGISAGPFHILRIHIAAFFRERDTQMWYHSSWLLNQRERHLDVLLIVLLRNHANDLREQTLHCIHFLSCIV